MHLSARRALLFVLICVLGGSLAVATGATVLDDRADTLANDRVAIQPAADTPYASLDENDELVVDLTAASFEGDAEGLNVNSITTFDGLFTITYTADEFAEVWLETESDLLTFTANGESIEGKTNNVTLGPNDTVSVGIAVDTRGVDVVPGTVRQEDFAVHANVMDPEEADIDEAGDSSSSSDDGTRTIVEGDGDERSVRMENVDDGETVSADLDGTSLYGTNVTLDRLDLTSSGGGTYELGVHGTPDPIEDAGPLATADGAEPHAYLVLDYEFDPERVEELTLGFSADSAYLDDRGVDGIDLAVLRATGEGEWEELDVDLVAEADADERGLDADRTHFESTTTDLSVFAVANHVVRPEATDASVADAELDAGEETTVSATVENVGGAAGDATVTLETNGTVVDDRNVTLDPGESTTVTFPVAFETGGVYDVTVLGTDAGTVVVGPDEVEGADEGDSSGTDAAIVGPDRIDEGAGGNAAGGGSSSDDAGQAAAAPPGDGSGPLEEPAGLSATDLGGLLLLVLVVLTMIALVRRAPRGGR